MTPSPTLLDLVKIPQWLSTTEIIVKKLIPKSIRTELTSFDPDEMYSDTMSFLIKPSSAERIDRLDWSAVWEWSARFDAAFLDHYTHIRGFHSCRAFGGIELYKTQGIRKLSRALLRELAHTVFGNHATSHAIDAAVQTINISSSEESVYLFTDSVGPLDSSCSHYLRSGSEMLQALSIALGIPSRRILASQGQAYLIECDVPLKDVSKTFRWDLWRKFVTECFRIAAGGSPPTEPYETCIRVTEPIEPSSILAFHPIDDAAIKCIAPPH